jgi:hypothetical protein
MSLGLIKKVDADHGKSPASKQEDFFSFVLQVASSILISMKNWWLLRHKISR